MPRASVGGGYALSFENASSEDYQKASLRILRYKDQDITLVDAVIADRLDAPVWTFDHHFHVMEADV